MLSGDLVIGCGAQDYFAMFLTNGCHLCITEDFAAVDEVKGQGHGVNLGGVGGQDCAGRFQAKLLPQIGGSKVIDVEAKAFSGFEFLSELGHVAWFAGEVKTGAPRELDVGAEVPGQSLDSVNRIQATSVALNGVTLAAHANQFPEWNVNLVHYHGGACAGAAAGGVSLVEDDDVQASLGQFMSNGSAG